MLYNIVVVSAIYLLEPAIGIYIYPLSLELPFFLPPHLSYLGCYRALDMSSLHHTAISTGCVILHTVMYMFQCYSLNSSHPLLPCLCPQVCFLCLHHHCCPADKIHQYHLSRFHIYELIYNISPSLSDFLHSAS